MAFDGSGSYSLASGNPVTTGTTISSTWANNTLSDIATALSLAVCKDGQSTPTANLPMGGFKLTGMGSGSAANDSARLGQVQAGAMYLLGTVAGTNTITAVAAPVITAYAAGQCFRFIPANHNTGATTINIDGVGAKDIYAYGIACSGNELRQNIPVEIIYDGTRFHIIGPVTAGTIPGAIVVGANFQVDGGSFIFNESGGNQDARFEGDTDVNLLFTDASADAVGIGTNTPLGGAGKLDIYSPSASVGMRTNYNGSVLGRVVSSSSGVVNIGSGSAHDVVLIRNDSTIATIGASGVVHNLPEFLKSYTVGTLPAATTAGGLIYVSDETGGAVPAFSDGANWRRVTDRAIVS